MRNAWLCMECGDILFPQSSLDPAAYCVHPIPKALLPGYPNGGSGWLVIRSCWCSLSLTRVLPLYPYRLTASFDYFRDWSNWPTEIVRHGFLAIWWWKKPQTLWIPLNRIDFSIPNSLCVYCQLMDFFCTHLLLVLHSLSLTAFIFSMLHHGANPLGLDIFNSIGLGQQAGLPTGFAYQPWLDTNIPPMVQLPWPVRWHLSWAMAHAVQHRTAGRCTNMGTQTSGLKESRLHICQSQSSTQYHNTRLLPFADNRGAHGPLPWIDRLHEAATTPGIPWSTFTFWGHQPNHFPYS